MRRPYDLQTMASSREIRSEAAARLYAQLVATAKRDERVVGIVLGGSRGKGALVTPESDYDVYVIVVDEDTVADWRARYPTRHGDPVEALVWSLDEFRAHAAPGSTDEWNRYTFAHVRAELDRLDGGIQELVDGKGRLGEDEARALAGAALDGYINACYRSAGNDVSLAARLDAAESIPWLLTFLFALDRRVRPYNKWLEWELRSFPLPWDVWSADRLLPRVEAIVSRAELADQQALFRDVEDLARRCGHGAVVEAWEPDLPRLRGEPGSEARRAQAP